jgi:hypothetical protein
MTRGMLTPVFLMGFTIFPVVARGGAMLALTPNLWCTVFRGMRFISESDELQTSRGNTMVAKVAKLVTLLWIIMVLVVACGGAPAAPDPNTAPAVEPTAAPGVGESSQLTSTPQAVAPPAEVEVHPPKCC